MDVAGALVVLPIGTRPAAAAPPATSVAAASEEPIPQRDRTVLGHPPPPIRPELVPSPPE
jgi:hypothetical protein